MMGIGSIVDSKSPRVMLHLIMPDQISGPNTATQIIAKSRLKDIYEFGFLVQNFHAGGKFNFRLLYSLIEQIKAFKPDVIHLSGLQASAFHAILAARMSGVSNVILTVRGSSTDSLTINPFLKTIFRCFIEPITLRLSSKVYTVAEAMGRRPFIRNNCRQYLGTIHNPAPPIEPSQIKSVDFRRNYLIDSDKIVVAIVGRIVYDKGIMDICQAIKRNENPRFVFVFIGTGPLVSFLTDNLSEEISTGLVFLLGKQEFVFSILSECDIFLFATLHENLSNALLEACTMGLPAIATNVGGNPEVIVDSYNGLLIEPGRPNEILAALEYFLNFPEEIKRMGDNGRKMIREKFLLDKYVEKLASIYAASLRK